MDCGFAEAEFFVDMLCSCVFEVGIKKTLKWYLDNMDWVKNVTSGAYQDYYKKMYGDK